MASSYSSSGPSRNLSRNNGTAGRPTIDRMPSVMGDTPVATNSALNKVGSASSSLYQNCRAVLDRLSRVPGFAQNFMDRRESEDGTGAVEAAEGVSSDPVSRSLHTLRLGSSLCYLFNALELDHILEVNPAATMSNLKACQRGTAHFIMACKQDLRWSDQDLFAIHELYGQDTNGVVKVINTVTKLLDKLEAQGALLAGPPIDLEPTVIVGPSDDRTMVVREILESERKYVQDLEVLQDYQRQVQANDIITQDQIHNLFLNLNSLADFQRRFLIGVEANASQPPEQQRFGHLFLQMEDNFSVYEPYCANLTAAQDLAIAENTALAKLSNILEPVSELAPLLIKPVQRLCKYPLLLQNLLKNTPESHPYYAELDSGLKSIMRVTDKVNETKRREDNRQAVIDLGQRVEDWKGHDIKGFGELLLQETFFVLKNDSEREYNVYLFERIILCCKESGSSGKKSSKSNSILKKPPNRRPTSLQLKGRIFVNNVTGAESVPRNGQCLLEVKWRGDVTEEAFTIKCRTEELLKQWQKTIRKAVDESPSRRRAHHLSSSRRSERGVNSPLSQFPGTPLSEIGPSSASFSSYTDPASPYPYSNSAQPTYPPNSNVFDDEVDDTYEYTESGRSTPSTLARRGPSMRSLPPGEREERTGLRPRAQTEDSTSTVINQWRNQTPGNPGYSTVPTLPRGASHASIGSESLSLRSSGSSRQLRHTPSTEWVASHPQNAATGYSNSLVGEESAPRPGVSRQPSVVNSIASSHSPYNGPLRNRSGSTPNIYQILPPSLPPTQENEWSGGSDSDPRGRRSAQDVSVATQHLSLSHKSGGTNSGGTLASASSISVSNRKRFSSSSNGTDRSSGASSLSATGVHVQAYTSASSLPSAPPTSGLPSIPNTFPRSQFSSSVPIANDTASALRVKVTFGEDTFVVVVLSNVSYPELVEKVLKKIRLCGDRNNVAANHLRLRYMDEDGDRILITSEEDVAMAIEGVKVSAGGNGGTSTLVLFASAEGS